jgi:hypothetical protein
VTGVHRGGIVGRDVGGLVRHQAALGLQPLHGDRIGDEQDVGLRRTRRELGLELGHDVGGHRRPGDERGGEREGENGRSGHGRVLFLAERRPLAAGW